MSFFTQLLDDNPKLEAVLEGLGGADGLSLATDQVVFRLMAACAIGWLIGFTYRRTFTGKKFSPTLPDTHLLLCLGGAMIWLVVGDNLVRAFGLAGTIGLIRYRTVVRDPKDTTILLFSMVLGMACGLGQFVVAVIGGIVVMMVMTLLHRRHQHEQAARNLRSASLLDLVGDQDDESERRKKPRKGEDFNNDDEY